MEKPTRTPLARSFERHMRAENRSDRTIATYLHGLRQAEILTYTGRWTSRRPAWASVLLPWLLCGGIMSAYSRRESV